MLKIIGLKCCGFSLMASLERVQQLFVNTAAALVVLHCRTNTLEATPEHPLRNPGSKSGRMVFGVEEQNKMLNQAKAYASQFDDVIYHSNSQALIDHYSALFRANGISNIKWVLTYE
jgi:hypothetical protein